jgi:adhesin transport system membrane fusion protein
MADLRKLKKHFDKTASTDLKYMSYSSEAMLQQSPGLSRVLLWVLVVFVLLMIVWASLAEVDEFTRAPGRIIPSSNVKVVQNLEGGILRQLMVQEGRVVEKDEPLLRIDDTMVSATFREKGLHIDQLMVKAARLRAQARRTDFDEELARYDEEFPEPLVKSERELYESRMEEFRLRHSVLEERAQQKRQELSAARSKTGNLEGSVDLLRRELNITRPLVEEGAVSHVEMLRLERQLNDLKGELEAARLAVPQLESAYQEARDNVATYVQNFTSEAREKLNEATTELERVQESNAAYADRVRRTLVRSPVRGTVKRLNVTTIGGVIQPGEDLVEIVPIEDSLLVDARVMPADIAFIHPGQKASVKFTAYDYSIYGGLDAKVTHISPDTVTDKEGNSFYEVRLVTESSHLGREDDPLPIIPGMTVQVDIHTGDKTIMDYLLKPILKTKQLALREK